MKEVVLTEAFLATAFLDAAINRVQKYVVLLSKVGAEVDPQFALDELQKGLKAANTLASKLSPRNFVVPEILKERRAIRKAKAVTV